MYVQLRKGSKGSLIRRRASWKKSPYDVNSSCFLKFLLQPSYFKQMAKATLAPWFFPNTLIDHASSNKFSFSVGCSPKVGPPWQNVKEKTRRSKAKERVVKKESMERDPKAKARMQCLLWFWKGRVKEKEKQKGKGRVKCRKILRINQGCGSFWRLRTGNAQRKNLSCHLKTPRNKKSRVRNGRERGRRSLKGLHQKTLQQRRIRRKVRRLSRLKTKRNLVGKRFVKKMRKNQNKLRRKTTRRRRMGTTYIHTFVFFCFLMSGHGTFNEVEIEYATWLRNL